MKKNWIKINEDGQEKWKLQRKGVHKPPSPHKGPLINEAAKWLAKQPGFKDLGPFKHGFYSPTGIYIDFMFYEIGLIIVLDPGAQKALERQYYPRFMVLSLDMGNDRVAKDIIQAGLWKRKPRHT